MPGVVKADLVFAASPALLERGCVNVIGLDEIRAKAGSHWEKLREPIWARLETLLRERLGPNDYYGRLNDVSFLVTMPAATAEEAQAACLRIAHQLRTALLGTCELEHLHVAHAVSTSDDVLELVAIKGDKLAVLAKKAGLPGDAVRTLRPLTQPAAAKAGPDHEPGDASYRFEPVWDVRREAITAYRCVASSRAARFGDQELNANFKADLAAMLDRVRFASRTLSAQLAAPQPCMVNIPITYELLSAPATRTELAAGFRTMASTLRPYFSSR